MKYGLIGEHLGHSFSKDIHEMLGRYTYELKEIPKEEIDAFMKARDFLGINVTIPYKQTVIPYLDEIDPVAESIGAVNCIVNKEGKLYGYNTDFYGMKALILKNGIEVAGKKALILGTGGTSRTAKAVLESLGAASIHKVSRHKSDDTLTYEEALVMEDDTQIIVNTTPCGMFPNMDAQPMELASFHELEGLVDVIYNPLRTRLVQEAEEFGVPAAGGLYMLVMQAVRAAEFFTGEPVPDEKGLEIYRKLKQEKENIVLTGMPGAGKSTVGKLLAKKCKVPFYDTDALLVEKDGREIKDIFAQDGEGFFRDLEAEVVKEVSLKSPCVISTGGGVILRDDNVENLKRNGRLVFLNRAPETIRPTDDRPLADDQKKVMDLYEKRLPIYRHTADAVIDVAGSPENTAREVLKCME